MSVAVMLTMLIGSSRVCLRVHWPTDVLGAFALGCTILAGFIFFITGAAIAHRGVKKSIAAKRDAASVVIEVGMIDFEQFLFALKIGAAIFSFEFGKGPGVIPIRRTR